MMIGCELLLVHDGIILYCGDSLVVMPSLPTASVDLIATSPPYNCRMPYDGGGDEWPWPEYYEFMGQVLDECYRLLRPGGVLALNVPGVVRYQHDHQYRDTWADFDPTYETHRDGQKVVGRGRIEPVGFRLFQMMIERDNHVREPIVWVKGQTPGEEICTRYQMGSDNNPYMRPAHELILLGSKDQWYHRGGMGRRGAEAVPFIDATKDVWYIQPVSHPDHPATWPITIPDRLCKLFIHAQDGVVLDPFMGVGTTLQAAKRLGFRGIGIDLSAHYCGIAARDLSQDYLFKFGDVGGNDASGDQIYSKQLLF